MVRKLWWPEDGSDEWLSIIDGWLGVLLLEYLRDSATITETNVLEVGVWKGAWTSVILKNIEKVRGFGIDPFPGRPDFENNLLSRLESIGLGGRFELFRTWGELNKRSAVAEEFSLIHIDGEHSETAVASDLRFASKCLTDRGMIVIDDWRHFWFPGIASAMYRFVHESEFAIFAVSENKAYLVKEKFHAEMQEQLRPVIENALGMSVWTSWEEWDTNREYSQLSDIGGYSVLLVAPVPAPARTPIQVAASARTSKLKRMFRTALVELTPPVFLRLLGKFSPGRKAM